jgi:hypothetical protein
VNRGPCEVLADLKPDRPRQFSLLLIEGIEVVHSEFERCRNMKQARSARPQARVGLSGQLARPSDFRLVVDHQNPRAALPSSRLPHQSLAVMAVRKVDHLPFAAPVFPLAAEQLKRPL